MPIRKLPPIPPLAKIAAASATALLAAAPGGAGATGDCAPAVPNLVVIYADDLGYGDMAAYAGHFGTTATADTPNMDRLADEGLMFTQGHSSNGVCTPSRYALLTAKYNWREFSDITKAYGEPMLPDADTTIAEFLQTRGYDTAAFGKWHLGGYFFRRDGTRYEGRHQPNITDPAAIDWEHRLVGHATDHGFDHFQGLATTINFAPYVYVDGDRMQYYDEALGAFRPATNEDTYHYFTRSELDKGLTLGAGSRDGLGDPHYSQVTAGPIMIGQVEDYLADRPADPDPFFAYVSLYSPHKPWHVTEPFQGSEGAQYPDFIHEVDHRIGRVLDALDANGLADNTVVVLTSDNGPEQDAFRSAQQINRDPNGPWRGVKRDVWEGGTRVPFVVRWPGEVAAPGTTTDALVWHGDIFRTIAAYLGADLPDTVAPDGESFLNILRGDPKPPQSRDSIVISSIDDHRAVKFTDGWKLIDSTGGGGRSDTWDADNNYITGIAGANRGTPKQLYNLNTDPGETNNRIAGINDVDAIRDELADLTGRDLLARLDHYRERSTSRIFPPFADNDRDGLPNAFETAFPDLLCFEDAGDAHEDPDNDGLDNTREYRNNADPGSGDSDGDRLPDAEEVDIHGTAPGTGDTDNDGLSDGAEILAFRTDPADADSDGDGVEDGAERDAAANPADPGHTPEPGQLRQTVLPPAQAQLAGVNGTRDNPAVSGGAEWPEAGDLFIRERLTGGANQEWRTRLFLKFDLSGIGGTLESARLRLHQRHKLNDRSQEEHTSDLNVSRVLEDWGTSPGSYPRFGGTPVTGTFAFGNNQDFGSAADASGFYGGAPGTPGDDSGFDPGGRVTTFAQGWHTGDFPNHGLRFAIQENDWVGVSFSETDDAGTQQDESPALLVDYREPAESFDTDNDRLPDAWEQANAGGTGNIDGLVDDDGDGFPNYAELAVGTDMADPSSRPRLRWELENGNLTFDFLRYRKAAYPLEPSVSDRLREWRIWTGSLEHVSTVTVNDDYERVTFRTRDPEPEKLFVRLRIGTPR